MGQIWEWTGDGRVRTVQTKRPKKITATRFAAVLGRDAWKTDFEVWCTLTRVYERPYEKTKEMAAGEAIEPKLIAYARGLSGAGASVKAPADVYGPDYRRKTYCDFFPRDRRFGGMWDAVRTDADGRVTGLLECKTTRWRKDWEDGRVPENYALQAALYAYLLGVEDICMVCSFLSAEDDGAGHPDGDYGHPEDFVPSPDNTVTVPFTLHGRYPAFESDIKEAAAWWDRHVVTGVSPAYDEARDADILKALREMRPQQDP